MQPDAKNSVAGNADPLETPMAPFCPVDRLPRRRRNQICVGIIAVGLLNFLAYTVGYADWITVGKCAVYT